MTLAILDLLSELVKFGKRGKGRSAFSPTLRRELRAPTRPMEMNKKMITMSIYDDECAELILEYVVERFDEWCRVVDTQNVTPLEFALTNYDDFCEWARNRDFIVTLDREP